MVLGITKTSLTWEFLRKNPVATVSFLGEDGYELARHFGLQSGRTLDKFAGVPHRPAANGCPVLTQCISFMELALLSGAELDAGSHTVFLAEVKNGGVVSDGKPLTYARYHEIKRG